MPGIGKTLAIAKLAAHARTRGCAVRLVTCDGTRRASVEQLRHFAATLGIEIEIAADVAALSALGQGVEAFTAECLTARLLHVKL